MSRLVTDFLLFISALALVSVASAQTAADRAFELNVEGAVFLPSRIYKVKELMNGVDVRVGMPTGKGVFELDGFFANSDGVNEKIVSLDYHYDVGTRDFPAFILAGLHGDFWNPPVPNESLQFAGGWHFGGGFTQSLFGRWAAREDFRYRLGPGTSLLIGLGLSYQFSN